MTPPSIQTSWLTAVIHLKPHPNLQHFWCPWHCESYSQSDRLRQYSIDIFTDGQSPSWLSTSMKINKRQFFSKPFSSFFLFLTYKPMKQFIYHEIKPRSIFFRLPLHSDCLPLNAHFKKISIWHEYCIFNSSLAVHSSKFLTWRLCNGIKHYFNVNEMSNCNLFVWLAWTRSIKAQSFI